MNTLYEYITNSDRRSSENRNLIITPKIDGKMFEFSDDIVSLPNIMKRFLTLNFTMYLFLISKLKKKLILLAISWFRAGNSKKCQTQSWRNWSLIDTRPHFSCGKIVSRGGWWDNPHPCMTLSESSAWTCKTDSGKLDISQTISKQLSIVASWR